MMLAIMMLVPWWQMLPTDQLAAVYVTQAEHIELLETEIADLQRQLRIETRNHKETGDVLRDRVYDDRGEMSVMYDGHWFRVLVDGEDWVRTMSVVEVTP